MWLPQWLARPWKLTEAPAHYVNGYLSENYGRGPVHRVVAHTVSHLFTFPNRAHSNRTGSSSFCSDFTHDILTLGAEIANPVSAASANGPECLHHLQPRVLHVLAGQYSLSCILTLSHPQDTSGCLMARTASGNCNRRLM